MTAELTAEESSVHERLFETIASLQSELDRVLLRNQSLEESNREQHERLARMETLQGRLQAELADVSDAYSRLQELHRRQSDETTAQLASLNSLLRESNRRAEQAVRDRSEAQAALLGAEQRSARTLERAHAQQEAVNERYEKRLIALTQRFRARSEADRDTIGELSARIGEMERELKKRSLVRRAQTDAQLLLAVTSPEELPEPS